MLSDMGLINTPIARYAIATAVLNDVVALFILGIVLALPADSGTTDLLSGGLTACAKLLGLLALVASANLLIRWLEGRGINLSSISERLIGMPHREAFALGAVLNGRGVMELVVATIAYDRGFIGPTMFSVLVPMGVVTTVLSLILLNAALGREARERYARANANAPPQDR